MKERVRIPLFCLALLIGGLAVIQGLPADPPPADRTEHVIRAGGLPPILPETSYRQVFTAQDSGLSRIRGRFGTYEGAKRCTIRVELVRELGGSVARRDIPCRQIPDHATFTLLRFPPQTDSEGTRYVLTLSVLPGLEESVLPLGGVPKENLEPAEIGGKPSGLAFAITTQYGEPTTVGEQLGLALRRAGQYRIAWGKMPWPVVLFVSAICCLLALALAPRLSLALLLGAFFLKGVLWSVIVPPLEAPDEGAHFAYVQFMYEQGKIPRRGVPALPLPPYSRELTKAISVLNVEAQDPGDRPNFGPGDVGPDEDDLWGSRRSSGDGAAAGYSPVFYAPATIPYLLGSDLPLPMRVGLIRIWSVILGVATGWVIYLIGLRIFRGDRGAASALAIASMFQPMVSQQTAAINNDALVILGGALSILAALRLAEPERSRKAALFAGLAVGLAALAKPIGLLLVPGVAIAFLVGRVRDKDRSLASWFGAWSPFAIGLAATYGVWYLVSKVGNYSSLAFSEPSIPGAPRGLSNYLYLMKQDGFASLRSTWVHRVWGEFSWLDTRLPEWVYSGLTAVTVVVAGLVIIRLVSWLRDVRRRPSTERDSSGPSHLLVLAAFIVTVIGLLHVIEFSQFSQTGRAALLQGRYALMVLPAIMAIPILTVVQMFPRLKVRIVSWVMATGVIGLHLLSIGVLMDRFYL